MKLKRKHERIWLGHFDGDGDVWCQNDVFDGDGVEYVRAEALEAERERSRTFAGLVQVNPDWRCPYGEPGPTIGHCQLGFPGCACADDALAVLCEDSDRIVSKLRADLEAAKTELAAADAVLKEWTDNHKDVTKYLGQLVAENKKLAEALRLAVQCVKSDRPRLDMSQYDKLLAEWDKK